ncbi:hypothetical protein HPB50_016553 [Hyalomma asiaticum]|uniref:Uncharacterized protein n=1 Tax=Hyalomma asiaticum TaxID=266040 RepID=A0ACB7T2V2_HYAAI|nr:hypothetical protein HPB50_016553 [Hyalomma asiaticum]
MASLFPRRRSRRDKRRCGPEGRDKRAAAQQTETRAPADEEGGDAFSDAALLSVGGCGDRFTTFTFLRGVCRSRIQLPRVAVAAAAARGSLGRHFGFTSGQHAFERAALLDGMV